MFNDKNKDKKPQVDAVLQSMKKNRDDDYIYNMQMRRYHTFIEAARASVYYCESRDAWVYDSADVLELAKKMDSEALKFSKQ
jgi:hypothetical protein